MCAGKAARSPSTSSKATPACSCPGSGQCAGGAGVPRGAQPHRLRARSEREPHLALPCARARIEVEMTAPGISWSGKAYLDHNRGAEPLEQGFNTWHWSRAHLKEGALVCYEGERGDGSLFASALAVRRKGVPEPVDLPPIAALPRSKWRSTAAPVPTSAWPKCAARGRTRPSTPAANLPRGFWARRWWRCRKASTCGASPRAWCSSCCPTGCRENAGADAAGPERQATAPARCVPTGNVEFRQSIDRLRPHLACLQSRAQWESPVLREGVTFTAVARTGHHRAQP
jgi:hypothetical protein